MTDETRQVWDMAKVRRWVEAGAHTDHEDVVDAYTLRAMESDGVLTLDEIGVRDGRNRLIVRLTALGEHEADRLEALSIAHRADEGGPA